MRVQHVKGAKVPIALKSSSFHAQKVVPHKLLLSNKEIQLVDTIIVLVNNEITYQTDRRLHRVGEAVSVLQGLLVFHYRSCLSTSLTLPCFLTKAKDLQLLCQPPIDCFYQTGILTTKKSLLYRRTMYFVTLSYIWVSPSALKRGF